jgi:PAS domain S-box-containing protein
MHSQSIARSNDQNTLLAQALGHLSSGVVITDALQPDNPIIYINAAFTQLTGYNEEDVLGRNCRLLQGAETDASVVNIIREAVRNGHAFRGLLQNYRKDGTQFGNALIITPITGENGEVTHFLGTLNDVSTSREQLRALAAHATKAREGERTSIAREIHDELGQALTALKMDLAWLDKHMKKWFESQTDSSSVEAGFHERTRGMITLTEDTIHTVRRIATQLRPALLDDLGLEAAAEWQVKDFAERTGLVCDFKSDIGDFDLDPALATAGFRILQEALTNVARHAEATRVKVRLDVREDDLHLEVRDDGRGIRPYELINARSLGLLGMRERALALGGKVEIKRAKPRGTSMVARLPLDQPVSEDIQ